MLQLTNSLTLVAWINYHKKMKNQVSSNTRTFNVTLHTYIGHYNPSLRLYAEIPLQENANLGSEFIRIFCCTESALLFLSSTPYDRFLFEKLFHGRLIYSQSFCQKSDERKSPKKYFFFHIFV